MAALLRWSYTDGFGLEFNVWELRVRGLKTAGNTFPKCSRNSPGSLGQTSNVLTHALCSCSGKGALSDKTQPHTQQKTLDPKT